MSLLGKWYRGRTADGDRVDELTGWAEDFTPGGASRNPGDLTGIPVATPWKPANQRNEPTCQEPNAGGIT